MTDPTPPSEQTPIESTQRERRATGAWRIVSILGAVVSLLVVVLWILQSRQASDLVAPVKASIKTSSVSVVVDRMTPPADASIISLGLNPATAVRLDSGAATIDVPASFHSLIALIDEDQAVHGLAIAAPQPPGDQVVLSPRSTGEALLVLSPGILDADVAKSVESITRLSQDAAFVELETALLASSNLSEENSAVELALAAILDRVAVAAPLNDQGCDSIVDQRAYAVAGACVDPVQSGALISNEQDRWALVFAGPEPFEQVCAALMPANASQSRVTVDAQTCGSTALLTAPGPAPEERAAAPYVQSRVRDATAVQLYTSFVAPWADLAGGAAGLSSRASDHVISDPAAVISAVETMRTGDVGVADALSIALVESSPVDRHQAAMAVTRAMLSDDHAEQFASVSLAGLPIANELLAFFERAGANMSETERLNWKWTAPSSGLVLMGADS